MGSTPNWTAWLNSVWGPSAEISDVPGALISSASNFVFGTNPPYTIQDFLAMYPKWGGTPITPAPVVDTTVDSADVTLSGSGNSGIIAGLPVAGPGIPNGTFVKSVSGSTVTLTQNATATATGVSLTVWNAPPIPFAATLAYVALASSCLVQARWLEAWPVGMSLFIAHFLTLFARSDGSPDSSTGQVAAQGIATGIQVAKSVGDVSVNYQPIEGIENWAAWNLTIYGQQLATMARLVGAGPVLLY